MGKPAQQTTIARPVTEKGIGLHTGEMCAVSLLPAEPDAGIVFVAGDGTEIPALADRVVETTRGTVLGVGAARVGGVEHLMAAAYGLGLDNMRVSVQGPELPACDGSATPWVRVLRSAGIRRLGTGRAIRTLSRDVWIVEGETWMMAGPATRGLSLAVAVQYDGTIAGRQTYWLQLTPEGFARELAPARTFAMLHELERLRAQGLARGGTEETAFAVLPDRYSGPLRFGDEVVRHKMLDLVGDLALCGERFHGHVVAIRPGHHRNVALARGLREAFDQPDSSRAEARSD
ncbi:MAG: UDP-3-O-[3-hydroxymyristoyl] N-acetylglucosamine deacetylase [Armatimonadetes bacterium]|nr:UDP-3-O-[3-hydroxymyristoyl] N-acetylglucosamine deacetylase [Armatimonadota bacterium]